MAMLDINQRLQISDAEFAWTFARSGGPGGQNVNKVASKATLLWDLSQSSQLPDDVKQRLVRLYPRHFTREGNLVLTSQRYRDQDRNRQDCLEKLQAILVHALHVPRVRKKTKPTRGSQRRRLQAKKHRSVIKGERRATHAD